MSVPYFSSNDSLLHPNLSSINSILPYSLDCFMKRPGSFIISAFFITNISLTLFLCVPIFYLGFQQWRQQRSTSTVATSHTDIITYHAVTTELCGAVGYIICLCGVLKEDFSIFWVGYCLWCFYWCGVTLFHVLTCVERYLAVIHPVTYLSLKSERGIRIRNISIGCVWLISAGVTGLMFFKEVFSQVLLFFSTFSVTIVSFCSLSVLFILIRPGPGDQHWDRKKVDQSKLRAFYTIMAILGVLLMRFAWNLTWAILNVVTKGVDCVLMATGVWFNIPSSLVLPLLFLQRAGTLLCFRNNNK